MWDPSQYLRHAGPRLRPLHDLLARVPDPPGSPAPRVADLGCGPGGPSAELSRRWPAARITGYDNSPAMLERARRFAAPGLDFAPADLATWAPSAADGFGLLFSNAALQWVPGHASLFAAWLAGLPSGGILAFQVPGNFDAPSHVLLASLCESPHWRARLGDLPRGTPVLSPSEYASALRALGCTVDTWSTTYLHLLTGPDPVLDWTLGTALRPALDRLSDDPDARSAFLAEYGALLRDAYPPDAGGVTEFPFRRVFVVAVKG